MSIFAVGGVFVIILLAAFHSAPSSFGGTSVSSSSSFSTSSGSSSSSESLVGQRFGFGFLEPNELIAAGYSATTFSAGYWGTPPYPSVVMFNLGTTSHWSGKVSQDFIDSVGNSLAPNQNVLLTIGLNDGETDLKAYMAYVNHLGNQSFKSQVLVGVDGEHTHGNFTKVDFDQSQSIVNKNGMKLVNRYIGNFAFDIGNAPILANTNWPFNGQESSAVAKAPNSIGIDIGLELTNSPFPSQGCTAGSLGIGTGYPGWSVEPFAKGFDAGLPSYGPCAADWPATLYDAFALNNGGSGFVLINVGLNSTRTSGGVPAKATFIGASGVPTSQNWDNPRLRAAIDDWLNANPNTYLTSKTNTIIITTSTTLTTESGGTMTTSNSSVSYSGAMPNQNASTSSSSTTSVVMTTTQQSSSPAASQAVYIHTFRLLLAVYPLLTGSLDPPAGAYFVSNGTTLNIRAFPADGWAFDRWLANSTTVRVAANDTFVATGDTTLTAVFVMTNRTASTNPAGAVMVFNFGEPANAPAVVHSGSPYSVDQNQVLVGIIIVSGVVILALAIRGRQNPSFG